MAENDFSRRGAHRRTGTQQLEQLQEGGPRRGNARHHGAQTPSVRAVTPAPTQGVAQEGTAHQTFPGRAVGKRVSNAGSSRDLAAGRAPLARRGWLGSSQGPSLSLGPREAALNTHLRIPRGIGTSGAAPVRRVLSGGGD